MDTTDIERVGNAGRHACMRLFVRMGACLLFVAILNFALPTAFGITSWFVPSAYAGQTGINGRVETRIPAAAKKRDLALIHKFLDVVLQGKQIEARDLLNPYYSGAASEESGRQVNYASEKLPQLKIFGNKDAEIEEVYYFRDVVSRNKHHRYYFVIYKPGLNHLDEVMKIELINHDNIFYLNDIWAPKRGNEVTGYTSHAAER